LVLGEDGIDRASLYAGVAVDALLGIDEQLLDLGEVRRILRRVYAVNGADLDTREVLTPMQGSAIT
jgi:hypothetical protein